MKMSYKTSAGISYLALGAMFMSMIGIIIYIAGFSGFAEMLREDMNSFQATFGAMSFYALVSFTLAGILLIKTKFSPATARWVLIAGIVLVLIHIPLILLALLKDGDTGVAVQIIKMVVYAAPLWAVYRFYQELMPNNRLKSDAQKTRAP